jgi:hypothetical protein
MLIAVLETEKMDRGDLEEKSIFLSGKILEMVGKSKKGVVERNCERNIGIWKSTQKIRGDHKCTGAEKEIGKEGSFSKKVFAAKSGKLHI